jgi:broad specificity phosphatase PhoE
MTILPMTTWHWVRHGPTHEKRFVGWRDVPADLSNIDQISRLRAHLPQAAVLVSSDLIRCTATADAIAGPGHQRLDPETALRELHFGEWDGLHFSQAAQRDPELSRAYWETPGDIQPPGGESWNQTSARVNAAVERLNAAHPGAHIIAVAHFGVILTQAQRAMNLSASAVMAHKIDNLSVTEIRFSGDRATLAALNHIPGGSS